MKRASWGALEFGGMTAVDWVDVVRSRRAATEVVHTCVGFLSHWTAEQRAKLPESCQPPLTMTNDAQVSAYALRLAQARLLEARPGAELDAISAFFAAAATRLSQLLTPAKSSGTVAPFFNRSLVRDHDD